MDVLTSLVFPIGLFVTKRGRHALNEPRQFDEPFTNSIHESIVQPPRWVEAVSLFTITSITGSYLDGHLLKGTP